MAGADSTPASSFRIASCRAASSAFPRACQAIASNRCASGFRGFVAAARRKWSIAPDGSRVASLMCAACVALVLFEQLAQLGEGAGGIALPRQQAREVQDREPVERIE